MISKFVIYYHSYLQNQFSNSSSVAVIEANNKNKLKSGKGTTGESDSPTHKLESNVVLQDVLSIKSYLHKLSRILQVRVNLFVRFIEIICIILLIQFDTYSTCYVLNLHIFRLRTNLQ